MRVEYHPAVEHDVAEALRRYDAVSQRLGEEFKADLRRLIAVAAAKPGRFHLIKPGFHAHIFLPVRFARRRLLFNE